MKLSLGPLAIAISRAVRQPAKKKIARVIENKRGMVFKSSKFMLKPLLTG
jgi:hypothetical protein